MPSSASGLLSAGGTGLFTGLLGFLLEMTARFAYSHFWTGARPPADYLLFLVYYSLAGFAAGLAVYFVGRAATRISKAGKVAVRTAGVLGVTLWTLLAVLLLRAVSRSDLAAGVVLRHLGVALLACAVLALGGWGLVRCRKRYGTARLLICGGVPAALLLAGHLVFLHETALERVLGRLAVPGSSSGQPNVLLVSIDTLRADRLHSYGYPRQISPNMDRLAREGALFEQAVAHSPWTQPSFASILTSTYPSQHGSFVLLAPQTVGDGKTTETILYQSFLQDDEVTLAELFRDQGYSTIAVQALCKDQDLQRFDQGFQVYLCASQFISSMWDHSVLGLGMARIARLLGAREERHSDGGLPEADEVFDSLRVLISRALPRPFFIWINFRDPHSPYLLRQSGVPVEDALVVDSLRPEDAGIPTPALSAAYDDEIRFVDHYVGRALDLLRDRGLLDETVVVLTSDHGEEFEDHFAELRSASTTLRGRTHGHSLYSELLHVPLLIRYPPKIPPGTRITALARHVDILPTILDIAGIEPGTSGEHIEGRSLLPLLAHGAETGGPRLAYSERNLFGPQRRSIQDGRYKLILEIDSGQVELYDLAADPGERENLAAVRKQEAARLLGLLDRWAERMGPVVPPSPEAPSPDADPLAPLRALGYVE